MSHPKPAHPQPAHQQPPHLQQQTHQHTTISDVGHSNVSDIFNAIWSADKFRIQAFHEKRFPTDVFHGMLHIFHSLVHSVALTYYIVFSFDVINTYHITTHINLSKQTLIYHTGKFVVKLCDTRRGDNVKAHNLFKLYKWNEVGHVYKSSTNTELLKDADYKSYKLVNDLFDNYESDETKPEVNTKEECQEILDFLGYVVDSECMKV